MTSQYLLGKLTRQEFRQRMNAGELQACILPTAAIEQHLEHLAMEHDWRSVNVVAEEVARGLAPRVLVAQGVMAGVSEHHMTHAGTLTLSPGTFLAVVRDLLRSLVKAGFQHILVLNGHGGNVIPCQAAWDQVVREFQVNVQFMSYWDVLNEEDAKMLKSGHRIPEDLPGHAQEFETSIALARFPENVRARAMAEQADQTPVMATSDLGEQMLARVVQRLSKILEEMMSGARTQPIPPFHP